MSGNHEVTVAVARRKIDLTSLFEFEEDDGVSELMLELFASFPRCSDLRRLEPATLLFGPLGFPRGLRGVP